MPKDIIGRVIAYETGELEEGEVIELFQDLIDNGLAWTLNGTYGRMAMALIQAGDCTVAPREVHIA
jgi:hypothetical protein